jgi:hypothetical protein
MDATCGGLKLILRRLCAPWGQPVHLVVGPRHDYEGREYVYGCGRPAYGSTRWVLLLREEEGRQHRAGAPRQRPKVGPTKQIMLALDGAG